MHELETFYDDRFAEVSEYLTFVENIDDALKSGQLKDSNSPLALTVRQINVIYSGVYLQLYNLVEATMTQCFDTLSREICAANVKPRDLNVALFEEWLRTTAKIDEPLNSRNRLRVLHKLLDSSESIIGDFKFLIRSGGNWDSQEIENAIKRFDISLTVAPDINTRIKRHRVNNLGALEIIKEKRNGLGHGSLSFVECGKEITLIELLSLADAVHKYLACVVHSFVSFFETLKIGDRFSDEPSHENLSLETSGAYDD